MADEVIERLVTERDRLTRRIERRRDAMEKDEAELAQVTQAIDTIAKLTGADITDATPIAPRRSGRVTYADHAEEIMREHGSTMRITDLVRWLNERALLGGKPTSHYSTVYKALSGDVLGRFVRVPNQAGTWRLERPLAGDQPAPKGPSSATRTTPTPEPDGSESASNQNGTGKREAPGEGPDFASRPSPGAEGSTHGVHASHGVESGG